MDHWLWFVVSNKKNCIIITHNGKKKEVWIGCRYGFQIWKCCEKNQKESRQKNTGRTHLVGRVPKDRYYQTGHVYALCLLGCVVFQYWDSNRYSFVAGKRSFQHCVQYCLWVRSSETWRTKLMWLPNVVKYYIFRQANTGRISLMFHKCKRKAYIIVFSHASECGSFVK